MQHDTPGETAQPGGVVRDWARGDVLGIPGKTMPSLPVVERDYTAIADKLAAVGPLADKLGFTVKNVTYDSTTRWLSWRRRMVSCSAARPTDGRRWTPTSSWPRRS